MPDSDTDQAEQTGRGNEGKDALAPNQQPDGSGTQGGRDTNQDEKIRDLQEESLRRERATYRLAIAGVLIALGSVAVSTLQWDVMRDQLADARASGADAGIATLRAYRLAKQQADSMKTLAKTNKAMADAANIGNVQARESFQFAERANITIESANRWQYRVPGGKTRFDVFITNIGKTPANNVDVCSVMQFGGIDGKPIVFDRSLALLDDCAFMSASLSMGSLTPHPTLVAEARRYLASGRDDFTKTEFRRIGALDRGRRARITVHFKRGQHTYGPPGSGLSDALTEEEMQLAEGGKYASLLFILVRVGYTDMFAPTKRRNTLLCGEWVFLWEGNGYKPSGDLTPCPVGSHFD